VRSLRSRALGRAAGALLLRAGLRIREALAAGWERGASDPGALGAAAVLGACATWVRYGPAIVASLAGRAPSAGVTLGLLLIALVAGTLAGGAVVGRQPGAGGWRERVGRSWGLPVRAVLVALLGLAAVAAYRALRLAAPIWLFGPPLALVLAAASGLGATLYVRWQRELVLGPAHGGRPLVRAWRALATRQSTWWALGLGLLALVPLTRLLVALVTVYTRLLVPSASLTAWLRWAAASAAVGAAFLLWETQIEMHVPLEETPSAAPSRTRRWTAAGAQVLAVGVAVALAVVAVHPDPLRTPRRQAQAALAAAVAAVRGADGLSAYAAARRATATAAGSWALVLDAAGDPADALSLGHSALSVDPTTATAWEAVGLSAAAMGDASTLQEAVQGLSDNGDSVDARLLAQTGTSAPGLAAQRRDAALTISRDGLVASLLARPNLVLAPRHVVVAPAAAGATTNLPDDPLLSAAATLWADELGGAVTRGASLTTTDWIVAALEAERDALTVPPAPGGAAAAAGPAWVPGLAPSAGRAIGLALLTAYGRGGAAAQYEALLPTVYDGQAPDPATAQSLLQSGLMLITFAPQFANTAVGDPFPAGFVTQLVQVLGTGAASPEALDELGDLDLLSMDRTDALTLLGRAAAGAPRNPVILDDLALAQYEAARYYAAVATANQSIRVRRTALAEVVKGNALLGTSPPITSAHDPRLAQAAAALTAGLRIEPQPFLPWMALGDVYRLEGRPQAALANYRTAFKWYIYDTEVHLDSMASPAEPWGLTGMGNQNMGGQVLQGRIAAVQAEVGGHGGTP